MSNNSRLILLKSEYHPGFKSGWLIGCFISLFSACATPQFMVQPSEGVTIMPDGKMATLSHEGLAISVYRIPTPYDLNDKITTFRVSLINQTDNPIEFIPKQYLLFDQNNRQFLALTKSDLTEVAETRGGPHGSMSWGFGFGTFRSHSIYSMHYYSNPYWGYDPWVARRSYQGLLAKALPIFPITVFPRAIVEGNLYFAVDPGWLRNVRLQITRLSTRPDSEQRSIEIPYIIQFTVIQS